MEFNNEEMFNSAFVDSADLEFSYSQENWVDEYDIDNCYLDPTEEFTRCAAVFPTSVKHSPQFFQSSNSPILHKLDKSDNFSLPDSCLLFTTSDNLESEMDQLTTVSNLVPSEKTSNESMKINCKNVYKYLVKPITSNKLVKKLVKKCNLKSSENNVQVKPEVKQSRLNRVPSIPVKLYSISKNSSNQETPRVKRRTEKPKKFVATQSQVSSNSMLVDNLTDNNFVNCGEFVTYFV